MEAENKYLWLGNHTENKYLWLGNHTSFAKLYLYIYIIINNYVYNKGGGIWSRITIIELCFVLHCEMEQPCDDPRYAWIITRLFHFTMEDSAKFYDCSILCNSTCPTVAIQEPANERTTLNKQRIQVQGYDLTCSFKPRVESENG